MSTAVAIPGAAGSRAHLLIPVGVLVMLALVLVPLPTPVLDLLITCNIAASLVILIAAMYVPGPTEFSAFPSILLLATLFRLSLNIASTRLILLHGEQGTVAAGRVINAFGSFVVGGSFTVGLVIFLVLLVVQFVVIAHGSTRISEVTARFTLDALPGKQMAIDADLNAGLITEREAIERRNAIQREAEFFGSMDGAVRFTQRDAVASLLITLINIVAGLGIGVLQKNMTVGRAVETYSVLTIGDGLVTAIPALLVAVAGGIITTRAAQQGALGDVVVAQLLLSPRPLRIAAATLLLLGLVPGLPTVAFLVLAAGAFAASRAAEKREQAEAEPEEAAAEPEAGEDLVEPLLAVDPLCVELGYDLLETVGVERAGGILDKIRALRGQIAGDMGFVVPPVRIRDNLQLPPDRYRILLRGTPIADGRIPRQRMLALDAGASRPIEGEKTRDPAFGLPALWIEPARADEAAAAGYTVVDPPSVLSTHLMEVIHRHADELLGRDDTARLIEQLQKTHPKTVAELVPERLTVGEVQRVLQGLLRERIPIRDLPAILEAITDVAATTREIDQLVEAARRALARTIVAPLIEGDGELKAVTLDPATEQELVRALVPRPGGEEPAGIDPERARGVVQRLVSAVSGAGSQAAVLVGPELRPVLAALLRPRLSHTPVLSTAEIPPEVRLRVIATVS
ncbi:MAG: flagellar biosynthesis protein FlhA [Acidobacteria bacterium]|nr:MAG: flagellar biosynthesis protein FlhA [Acidobacteriota bacterium]